MLFSSGYLQKESSVFLKIFQVIQNFRNFLFKLKGDYSNRRYFIHFGIGLIVFVIVFCNFVTARGKDEGSILFSLFSEEGEFVVEKGPLSKDALVADQGDFSKSALKQVLSQENKNDIIQEELPVVNENALLKQEGLLTAGESSDASISKEKQKKEIVYYTVKEGDTPGAIAAKFGIKANTVLQANNLKEGDYIKPGEKLTILPTEGITHKVRRGETVSQIAKKYNVDSQDIITYNDLGKRGGLKAGEEIIVPNAEISLPSQKIASVSPSSSVKRSIRETKKAPARTKVGSGKLVWPTTTRHISQYYHWGHRAIDINNDYQPIFAADDGYVESVGWHGGYGMLLVINHQNGMKTRYAHASKIYVKPGQKVSKGQKIARVGSTGRSTGPHLHFEVIVNGAKKNPLSYY